MPPPPYGGASGIGIRSRLAARQRLTQEGLIGGGGKGALTLTHITGTHAQPQPL
ncbi:hypothetical protein [Cribrihabitans pelagius]|uniref:hypothetical protein n=1 Tax=Cribrihabitans pelagius TaxID=1765746 RepID=UPI003B5B13E9